jgi:short-chain fatty acids transporter
MSHNVGDKKMWGGESVNAAGMAWPARLAQRCCTWSERWYPDPYVFAALAALAAAAAALATGAAPLGVATAFSEGFWSLIPFTMQMSFVVIGGYVVAASPPLQRAVQALARLPRSGRAAVGMVATISLLLSLIHWGLSLILSGLLVRALGRRSDLDLDYRAAGAAAYLGLGAVWAMGLSSSAAQLQANPASMPASLLAVTGVLPFSQTIFLWQSLALTAILIVVSVAIAMWVAPSGAHVVSAAALGVGAEVPEPERQRGSRPADRLERAPLLNVGLAALTGGWLVHEFALKGASAAIANLNTYNLLFLTLGLLLNWRPRRFLDAVTRAVPGIAGILIQFPLYGGIAALLTAAKGSHGQTLAQSLSEFFSHIATTSTFPLVMGAYSAVLGFFVPSGGGKWVIEAPYVMQTANDLHVHLGWAVQVYNAAEALPNLINPMWMLPLLAVVGLKARDIVGFCFLQLMVHVPLVLFLLWGLGLTLDYHPPVMPAS